MSESEQAGTVVELLLREPEIVAWLDDHRPDPRDEEQDEEDDFDPPHAA
jgi:hypothetical protein